jgi:hypothetical protein
MNVLNLFVDVIYHKFFLCVCVSQPSGNLAPVGSNSKGIKKEAGMFDG